MDETKTFQEYYRLLFSIAYRMLGSACDAEDIVQVCYVRYMQSIQNTQETIRSLKSYLTTAVTHLCLDQLRAARIQRDLYRGPWLPEPILTPDVEETALRTIEQRESISVAFLVLLECLTPAERAVFILHEAFGYPYQEIAEILDRSSVYCRQLFQQAKSRLAQRQPRFSPSLEVQRHLAERFLEACQQGDVETFIDILAEDVTAWSDGGSQVAVALRPIRGRPAIIRLLLAIIGRRGSDIRLALAELNGSIGLVVWLGGELFSAVTFDTSDNHIINLRAVANPDKLVYLQRQLEQVDGLSVTMMNTWKAPVETSQSSTSS